MKKHLQAIDIHISHFVFTANLKLKHSVPTFDEFTLPFLSLGIAYLVVANGPWLGIKVRQLKVLVKVNESL